MALKSLSGYNAIDFHRNLCLGPIVAFGSPPEGSRETTLRVAA